MKGLVRNNFYSMEGSIKMAALIALLLAATPFFVQDGRILQVVIAMQLYVFIVNTGASLHRDEVSKWNKFELTLPVRRGGIVQAKYISFVLLLLLGAAAGLLTVLSAVLSGMGPSPRDLLYGFEFGLTLSAITMGLMYPVLLLVGTDQNELITVLCAAAAVGVVLLISFALSGWTGEMDMHSSLVGLVSALAGLAIFAASYFVSQRIYRRKEFA